MSDIAIKVENLGKKYTIGHQKSGDLREAFGQKFKNLFSGNGKTHEEFWALKDVSFEVKKGEAVGIIGRNGAGKSTLLKLLSRITEPTKGRFEINGRVSSLLEVGTGFHPELTGRENIFLNGTILGMRRSEIKEKFDEIVDFSGVEKFIDTPVKHFSSGMKVRLAFSVAAYLEPEILIIDEVLAVGDAEFQKKCLGKMDQVSKSQGRTVLFVSHNMSAVRSLCKYSLLLQSGALIQEGETQNVIDNYYKERTRHAEMNAAKKMVLRGEQFSVLDCGIKDVHFKPITDIYCGQDLFLDIEYEAFTDKEIDIAVAYNIYNASDSFVTVLNNKIRGFQFNTLSEKGIIRCKIKKAPFMVGRYFINLLVQVNGKMILNKPGALSFFVFEADYYGSGFSNALGRSGVFIDHEWMLEQR